MSIKEIMICIILLLIISSGVEAQKKLPVQHPDTIYYLRLPNTGFLEVKVIPTTYTTRVMLEFEEFTDLKTVDIDQTKTFTITKPQMLYFQLINEPTNGKAFYTSEYTPSSGFSTSIQGWQTDTWDYSPAGGAIVQFRYRYVPLQAAPGGRPLIVCSPSQGPYRGPFERGLCSTEHCNESSSGPESWVRGRADLDPVTGQVALLLQLETDAVDAGPKGTMQVIFKNAQGATLGTINSKEVGVGGKSPGRSRIENIPSTGTIPVAKAAQVSSIEVKARCTGYVEKWFNLIPGKLEFTWTSTF
jgi:hypothetical protein